MAAVAGVREVHDLHVWDLGAGEPALSAHLVIEASHDCREVAHGVRRVRAHRPRIRPPPQQAPPPHTAPPLVADDCARDAHGPGYVGDPADR
jgi:cobalt-zinc-cadmium efflux system protein